jgi:hypothetical protein
VVPGRDEIVSAMFNGTYSEKGAGNSEMFSFLEPAIAVIRGDTLTMRLTNLPSGADFNVGMLTFKDACAQEPPGGAFCVTLTFGESDAGVRPATCSDTCP